MRWIDRLRRPLPPVSIDAAAEEKLASRVQEIAQASDAEGAVRALRGLVEQDMFAISHAFRAALGCPDAELATELYLHAGVGVLLAQGEEDRWQPLNQVLREYIAFGHRDRYDDGPSEVLRVANKINEEGRDPGLVALGMLPMRLGVSYRRGASEGLIQLASIAQQGGMAWGQR